MDGSIISYKSLYGHFLLVDDSKVSHIYLYVGSFLFVDDIISQKYLCGKFLPLDKSMISPQIPLCWGLLSVDDNYCVSQLDIQNHWMTIYKYLCGNFKSVDDNIVEALKQ